MVTRRGQIKEPRIRNRTEEMSADAMKAFDKGQNSGTMFRLDLDVMKANKINAEAYVRLWITAWHQKLTNEELEIATSHKILWYSQQAILPNGYPPNGIPGSKDQLFLLSQNGKMSGRFSSYNAVGDIDNNEELMMLSEISGDVIGNAADYYGQVNTIRKAMEHFRHYATVALGPKLSGPFDQGIIQNYNQLITWVYKKCNVTRSIESMADYFEQLDKAIHDDSDTDCCSMKFRMILDKLFQIGTRQEPIKFPDLEGDPSELVEKEKYIPSHSLMFLYCRYKAMDKKTWASIEDEFRNEIGGTNYNKKSWMENKPRLFEIIDQKVKSGSSRGSINKAQAADDSSSDEEKMEVEIEPGLIMYVSPKNKNGRQQNWKSKVQKYNAAAKRGLKSNNDNNNRRQTGSNWNNNTSNQSFWTCIMCPTQNGKKVQHKKGQKCPKNGFIPQRMIAAVQTNENDQNEALDQNQEPNQEGLKTVQPQVASMRPKKFEYDSSSTDSSGF